MSVWNQGPVKSVGVNLSSLMAFFDGESLSDRAMLSILARALSRQANRACRLGFAVASYRRCCAMRIAYIAKPLASPLLR